MPVPRDVGLPGRKKTIIYSMYALPGELNFFDYKSYRTVGLSPRFTGFVLDLHH